MLRRNPVYVIVCLTQELFGWLAARDSNAPEEAIPGKVLGICIRFGKFGVRVYKLEAPKAQQ